MQTISWKGLFVPVVVLLLLLSGCAEQPEENVEDLDPGAYVISTEEPDITEDHVLDKTERFGLVPPEGWKNSDSGAGVTLFDPDDDGKTASITATSYESKGRTVEQYGKANVRGAENQLEDFELFSESEITLPAGNAYEIVMGYTDEGTEFKAKHVMMVGGENAYIFAYTAYPEEYDKYIDDFDDAVATVVMKDSENGQ